MRFGRDSSEKLLLAQNKESIRIYIIKLKEIDELERDKNNINCKLKENEIFKNNELEIKNSELGESNDETLIQCEEYVINEISQEVKAGAEEFNKNANEFQQNHDTRVTFSEQARSIAENLTALSEHEKEILFNLLQNCKEVFSKVPGRALNYVHKLKLIKNNPMIRKTYPIPFALRTAAAACIKEMLEQGIIE